MEIVGVWYENEGEKLRMCVIGSGVSGGERLAWVQRKEEGRVDVGSGAGGGGSEKRE